MTPKTLTIQGQIEAWKPREGAAYYAHVGIHPDSTQMGIALVCLDSKRAPCHGYDCLPDDSYNGDILTVEVEGKQKPISGVFVQYVPLTAVNEIVVDEQRELELGIFSCQTDEHGRHSIWVPPGGYRYRYVTKMGTIVKKRFNLQSGIMDGDGWVTVNVPKARTIRWERILPIQSEDQDTDTITSSSAEIPAISEDLILDWTGDFNYDAVKEVIVEICKKCPRFKQLSFTYPPRADLLYYYRQKGIVAIDTKWRDIEIAAAYRNYNAVLTSHALTVYPHTKADLQLRRGVRVNTDGQKTKLEPVQGIARYLADARVSATYFAVQGIQGSAPLNYLPIKNLQQILSGDGSAPGMPLEHFERTFSIQGLIKKESPFNI